MLVCSLVDYEHVGVFTINDARSFYGSFLWVSIVWCVATLWIFFVGRQSKTRGGWSLSTKDFASMKQLSILSLCSCYDLTISIYHEVC